MKNILTGYHETILYPDASNMRVVFQRDPYFIEAHWHSGIEILMPFKGDYSVTIGNESLLLEKGDILFLHSGTVHTLKTDSDGMRLIFQFDIQLLYALQEFQTLLFELPSRILLRRDTSSSAYCFLLSLLLQISFEYRHKPPLHEAVIYSLILQLYTRLFRDRFWQMQTFDEGKKLPSAKNFQYQEKFLAVCRHLNQHLCDTLTLESAAVYTGFSKFHFSRLFKEFTGMTFSRYLITQRVHKAKLLLLTTDASIMDIAMESGFNSSSTFNRAFLEEEKISPTEFRKKYAKILVDGG